MRHRKNGRKFNRTPAHRDAMLRNLVSNLFEHGRVITTLAKAKEARILAEKCITVAKKGNAAFAAVEEQIPALKEESQILRQKLAAATDDKAKMDLQRDIELVGGKIAALQAEGVHFRRLALKKLHRKEIVQTLFEDIAPQYDQRPGGYTRILKAGFRKGDNAPRALFELV